MVEVLRRLYPVSGVRVVSLWDGAPPPKVALLPGGLVLVLGDLGRLASQGERLRRFWLNWGRR